MKKTELLMAVSLLFAACGPKGSETLTGADRIDLSTDAGTVEQKIKSISVVNFDVDDSWAFINQSKMTMTSNRYVFGHKDGKRLLMYDLEGKKVVDRSIQGRGPGELCYVNDIFAVDDMVYCYDSGMDQLISYDENGRYVSKWAFEDASDYLYRMGDGFAGLSNLRDDYVYVYDSELKLSEKHLPLDEFFKYNTTSYGLNPISYLYKDSLRLMLAYDYTIYSLSNGSFIPRFEFVTENSIPSSLYKKYEGEYQNSLDLVVDLMKGGYDNGFSSLAETDRYLFFEYFSSKGGNKTCLYDKRDKKLYRSFYPEQPVEEDDASGITCTDVWQYMIYYLQPAYSDGESVWFSISKDIYDVLKLRADILDDRLKPLYQELTRYMTDNTLSGGDLLILRVEFE